MKRSVRIALWLALALLVLGALAAAAAASWAWRELERERPVGASPQQPVVVEIEPGSSAGRILAQLFERGAIADPRLARLWLVYGMGDPPLQAGEYSIESPATTEEILGKLVAGDVVLHRATVIEGLTLEETAQSLSAQGFGDEEALLAAMRRPDAIRDLDPDATTLEGYLFPDTYAFPRGTDEAAVVKRMVDTFRRRLDQNVRSETAVENVRDGVKQNVTV